MTDSETVREKLRALVDQPTGGTGKPTVAPDPVNQPMIRHWAYALGDMNPVYLDPEFAAASRFGGIVSPPVMLQTWTMPSLCASANPRKAAFSVWLEVTLIAGYANPCSLARSSICP